MYNKSITTDDEFITKTVSEQDELKNVQGSTPKNAWQKFTEDQEKRKHILKDLVKMTTKDVTLLLTTKDIILKIRELIGVEVTDDWVFEHFKDAIECFEINYAIMKFRDFIQASDEINSFYKSKILAAYMQDEPQVEAISSVYAKFDIYKSLEILQDLISMRLMWKEYKGEEFKQKC